MTICVAQTRPVNDDIPRNIARHKVLIQEAVAHHADLILFPELSLTGYEPELAQELATQVNDSRLNDFQVISNTATITVGVGMPIKHETGTSISMIIFQPYKNRELYSKQYLHEDEVPFFVRGNSTIHVIGPEQNMALAICYELSVPMHAENAYRSGATAYLASVAKTEAGVERAISRLSDIARIYSMTVVMANCVGLSGGMVCGGKTSVWNSSGTQAGQLDGEREGILLFNTNTKNVVALYV